jgi:hypothetical protein
VGPALGLEATTWLVDEWLSSNSIVTSFILLPGGQTENRRHFHRFQRLECRRFVDNDGFDGFGYAPRLLLVQRRRKLFSLELKCMGNGFSTDSSIY